MAAATSITPTMPTSTTVPIYRGTDGWHARAIGALAADVKWPFIGPLFGGVQRLSRGFSSC